MAQPSDKVVMVVDDDPGVAKYCQTVMERAGYEVLVVHDARQAAGILQQTRVDLLLVDIRMPNLDGFQVMERARKHQPDLAVIMMTGYGTMETALKALRLGANGLILKPFNNAQELADGVQGALADQKLKTEIARFQALQPLIPISRSLNAETDFDKLTDLIISSVRQMLDCDHAAVYTRRTPSQRLELTRFAGAALPEEDSSLQGGPVARADAQRAALLVNDLVPQEPALRDTVLAAGFSSVLCAPSLRRADRSVVLFAGRSRARPAFTSADLEMFTIFANQAAVALENALLYADLRASLKRLQDQQKALIQSEKMAAIGRLTAGIAHEVNNPLQAVRNCLHLVARAELDEEKRANYLSLAQSELERLMDTMRRMLDFYRPSALQREPVDLAALLDTVIALLEKQMLQQNIAVEKHIPPNLPYPLIVKNQIQQVFFNIMLNAMEAMDGGGRIVVTIQPENQNLAILFEDTGPGVPAEERAQIFEPFVSSRAGGTGLGLFVSYIIADAHGGLLELVENGAARSTGGACFRLIIPVQEAT